MAKKSSNYRKYCSVYGCLNSKLSNPELSFFTLPSEEERHLKWLQLIAREDLITKHRLHYYVCEIHFNTQDVCKRSVHKVLKKNCFPCLNLPNQTKEDKQIQTDVKTSDDSTQTEISNVLQNTTEIDLTTSTSSCQAVMMTTSDNMVQTAASLSADTPRKRKLESELLGCEKRLRRTEWLRLISRQDLSYKSARNYCVCEDHFREQDILPGAQRKKLKATSLPCLKLPDLLKIDTGTQTEDSQQSNNFTQTQEIVTIVSHNTTQTPAHLSSNTPFVRKLKSELSEARKKIRYNEIDNQSSKRQKQTFHRLCDKFLTKELAELVKRHTSLRNFRKFKESAKEDPQ